MKANELSAKDLMIGDWVMINPISYYQVEQIRMEFGELRIYLKGTEVFATENEIMPVPLTPEILEKNGHKVPSYSVWDLEADGAEVQWVRETMDTSNPPMQYRLAPRQKNVGVQETLICHIKYVHELQHALRLCGITLNIEV